MFPLLPQKILDFRPIKRELWEEKSYENDFQKFHLVYGATELHKELITWGLNRQNLFAIFNDLEWLRLNAS